MRSKKFVRRQGNLSWKKYLVLFWGVILICVLLFGNSASASGSNTPSETLGRFIIHYRYEDQPVAGARFSIYKAGEVLENGKIVLSGDFAHYPVDMSEMIDSSFQSAADTLYGYAVKDQLRPQYIAETNASGTTYIYEVPRGLYLVAGEPCRINGMTYTCQPQLVVLPYQGEEDPEPSYSVTMHIKCSAYPNTPTPISLKVLKVWDDQQNSTGRPKTLTVHLLKNDETYSTVTLNAENNWRHTWTDLDPAAVWAVAEEVPEHYQVLVRREENTFVVTNTGELPPPKPSETPTESSSEPPSKPTETETEETTETGSETETEISTEAEETTKIPQTGLLWWPVPVLAVLGCILIGIGISAGRKK